MDTISLDEGSLKPVRDLGQGTYTSVSLKVHPDSRFYAKKTSSILLKENLKKELRIMLSFRDHPRIVQALSERLHFEDKDCSIYMEYASQGTLQDIISEFGGKPLPEKAIGLTTRMILQGLEALHSNGYVHCDLKPSNVLLFPSKVLGETWDVKIADFGFSREPNTDTSTLYHATMQYMPPEFAGRPEKVIVPAIDIWSLGCVVFEMFGGKPVKLGESYVWKLDHDISPVAIDFLRRCHAWNPSSRASATDLLKHPFIRQRVSVLQPIKILRQTPDDLLYKLRIEKQLAFISAVDWSQKTSSCEDDWKQSFNKISDVTHENSSY